MVKTNIGRLPVLAKPPPVIDIAPAYLNLLRKKKAESAGLPYTPMTKAEERAYIEAVEKRNIASGFIALQRQREAEVKGGIYKPPKSSQPAIPEIARQEKYLSDWYESVRTNPVSTTKGIWQAHQEVNRLLNIIKSGKGYIEVPRGYGDLQPFPSLVPTKRVSSEGEEFPVEAPERYRAWDVKEALEVLFPNETPDGALLRLSEDPDRFIEDLGYRYQLNKGDVEKLFRGLGVPQSEVRAWLYPEEAISTAEGGVAPISSAVERVYAEDIARTGDTPEKIIGNISWQIEQNSDAFIADIRKRGRNPDTIKLLMALGITDSATIDEIFPPWLEFTGELPTKGWLDKWEEIRNDPTKLIPFFSMGTEIGTLVNLLPTAVKLQSGEEVSVEELMALKEYVDRAQQDTDWGYKVADVMAQAIPFAAEFILTGGLGKLGTKGAMKALEKLATREGSKLLERKLAQMGVRAVGSLAGGTLRAIPMGATRVPVATLEKQLQAKMTGDEESVAESAVKAFGEHWVEVISETTGGMFKGLSDAAKGKLIKTGLFKAFQKANPGQSAANINKVLDKLGYHGVLEEMLEERVAEVMHGVLYELGLGDQPFKLPSLEQLSVELVAFSIPGLAVKALELPGIRELITAERGGIKLPEEKPEVTPVTPEVKKDWTSMTWYRGTKSQPIEGQAVRGDISYFTNVPEVAKGYAKGEISGRVIEAELLFKNPKIEKSPPMVVSSKYITQLKKEGYDALIQDTGAGRYDVITFEASQVKLKPVSISKAEPVTPTAPVVEPKVIPKAEAGEPEAGLQPSMIPSEVAAKEVTVPRGAIAIEGQYVWLRGAYANKYKTIQQLEIAKTKEAARWEASNPRLAQKIKEMSMLVWLRDGGAISRKEAIPRVKAVTPTAQAAAAQTWTEAGLQPSMLPAEVAAKEVRPVGKGKITQISMEDQLKLEQARAEAKAEVPIVAEEPTLEEKKQEAYEAWQEIEGIKATLETDKVANYTIKIPAKTKSGFVTRGLDFFISMKEGEFPEYFTVKQAKLINPHPDYSKYLQKGTKFYNKVPLDTVFDWFVSELGFTDTEALVEHINQIREMKRRIKELQPIAAQEFEEEAIVAEPEWATLSHQNKRDISQVNFYPTEKQAQNGAEALKRRHDFYETRVIKEREGVYRVQYRKLPETIVEPTREQVTAEVAPVETLPEPTEEEIGELKGVPDKPEYKKYTLRQWRELAGFMGDYVMSENAVTASALQKALNRKTRAQRFSAFQNRLQELVVTKGIDIEEAFAQAKETLAGKLPLVSIDYFDAMTDDLRRSLFVMVYTNRTLQKYQSELLSTLTALTNAIGDSDHKAKPIPRKRGTGSVLFPEGGSAWDRLNFVFGEQPRVLKSIEKVAEEGKSIKDVVEASYHETGREPIPVDQETAEYLRSLSGSPRDQIELAEKEGLLSFKEVQELTDRMSGLKVEDQRTLVEKIIEMRRKGLLEAPPVTKYEAPIDDAFRQGEMWASSEKQMLVRILKEIAWLPVDIGNFIRANKASLDNSFLRQSKVLASGHPLVGFAGHTTSWQSMFSQAHAEADWQRITRDIRFTLYEKLRLERGADPLRVPAFVNEKGTARYRRAEEYGFPTVERIIPKLTQKLPHVKYSERAFSAGTNKIVWLLWNLKYDSLLREAEKIGSGKIKLKEGEALDIVGEMGDFQVFLADAIQRARLPGAQELAPLYSAFFFAARSKLARFLFPRHLIGLTVRNGKVGFNRNIMKEAWRDWIMMNALFGGIMFLGEWLGLWDVEKDPRNAEFMSARIGNTRIDPWAGYRQFVVLYARLVTKTGVSSVTGAEYEVNPLGTMQSFFRNSLAPMTAILLDFYTGRNAVGAIVDITNAKEWIKQVLPFSVVDVWEAMEENQAIGALMVVPAIYGEGVQTYTGDWKENFTKLGLPKYQENTAYGLSEPKYDAGDLWADTASQFKGVDPVTLTKEKGYPPYVKAMAEAYKAKEQAELIPNQSLVSINADPAKGKTFFDYHKLWLERQKLVEAGDDAKWTQKELQADGEYKEVTYKGEKALVAFDENEANKQAWLGNFSQDQLSLLAEYWSITGKKKQEEFLTKHLELTQNLRDEWYKAHPKENAILAMHGVHGHKELQSKAAYDFAIQFAKEWDYPDSAIEPYLPPKDLANAHFERIDIVNERGANSWEDKLFRAKNLGWLEWHNKNNPDKKLNPIETPIASLELKVKNHVNLDLLDSSKETGFGFKGGINYKDDTVKDKDGLTERDRAIAKLYADNPTLRDDQRRIEAIEVGTNETPTDPTIVEAWVDRGKTIDQFGSGSSESLVWLLDNQDAYDWAVDHKLLEDIREEIKAREPVLRINVQFSKQDNKYDIEIPDKYNKMTDAEIMRIQRPPRVNDNYWRMLGVEEKRQAWIAFDRGTMLELDKEYRTARKQKDFYGLVNKFDVPDATDELRDKFVSYYGLGGSGYRQERMLLENPDLAYFLKIYANKVIPKPEDIPPEQYDDITDQYQKQFDRWDNMANRLSGDYLEDDAKDSPRVVARRRLEFDTDGTLSEFGMAKMRRDGYYLIKSVFVRDAIYGEQLVDDYVGYNTIIKEGKPKDWEVRTKQEFWFEDDWYMMEHMQFYQDVYIGIQKNQRSDFRNVPSRKVFNKWLQYNEITPGKDRGQFRLDNPDLDEWGVERGIWSKRMTEERVSKGSRGGTSDRGRMLEEIDKIMAGWK